MTLRIEQLTIDSTEPGKLASFWEAALGWRRAPDENEDEDLIGIEPPEGIDAGAVTGVLFLRVPEAKSVKNRLHLDLRPEDQAAEVARLEALGARRVDVGQGPDSTWVILADPEGNEFCVLRALRPDELSASTGG